MPTRQSCEMFSKIFLVFLPLITLSYQQNNCQLATDQDPNVFHDAGITLDLGSLKKTAAPADHITSLIVQENGLVLSGYDANTGRGCDKTFFTITQNGVFINVTVPDGFSTIVDNFRKNDASEECALTLQWDKNGPCGASGSTKIIYNIKDVNLSPPKFSTDSYQLKAPMPISQELVFSKALGVSLSSDDTDFSTTNVKYEIQEGSDDFEVVPQTRNNRTFPLDIKSKRILNFEKDVTILVTATDDGTDPGPLTSTATIIISPDLENSVPPTPQFKNYVFQASASNATLQVGAVLPIDIEFAQSYSGQLTLNILDGDGTFSVGLKTGATDKYSITVEKDLDQEQTYHTIQLEAVLSNGKQQSTGYSAVVLGVTYSDDLPSSSEKPSSPPSSPPSSDPPGSDPPSTDPTPSTEPPVVEVEDCDNGGLIAATIIFAIATICLCGMVAYGYLKYVRRPKTIQPTSQGTRASSLGGFENLSYLEERSPTGVAQAEKTRKRSMTFSQDDGESRMNREKEGSTSEADSLDQKDKSSDDSDNVPITSL